MNRIKFVTADTQNVNAQALCNIIKIFLPSLHISPDRIFIHNVAVQIAATRIEKIDKKRYFFLLIERSCSNRSLYFHKNIVKLYGLIANE